MTLTEQWKKEHSITENKGYYVVDDKGCSYIDFFWGEGWLKTPVDEIEEVLAPVPSFEEWQELKEQYVKKTDTYYDMVIAARNGEIEDLKKENQQLKELLKECRDDVFNYQYICLGTLTKIYNVLGEKK